jgi:hypothetical protein
MSAHRSDVHQHVVPPFWAKALPDHGGDPSGPRSGDPSDTDFPFAPADVAAYFTTKLDAYESLTADEQTAISHGNAWILFPRLAS